MCKLKHQKAADICNRDAVILKHKRGFVFVTQVHLRRTHETTLNYCKLEDLKSFAMDLEEATADVTRLDAMREALGKSVAMPDMDSPAEE